jgi:hypothetical protein
LRYWVNNAVVAALLLTMTVPYVLGQVEVEADGHDFQAATIDGNLQKAFGILMGISTLSSIGSILVAMAFYTELTVHMIDPHDKLWYLASVKTRLPEYVMIISLVCMVGALAVGVLLAHGLFVGVSFFISIFVMAILLGTWTATGKKRLHRYLDLKYKDRKRAKRSAHVAMAPAKVIRGGPSLHFRHI